jgi:hypothetical protein
MAVVAFDLDETLGRFSTPALHLVFINPIEFYKNDGQQFRRPEPSQELKVKCDKALTKFAECLASSDEGKQLLRPGILQIIAKVSDAQDAGLIRKIAVYSNNGNMNCLLLATRMIEFLLKKQNIFCDHINFWHPIRHPHNRPNYRRPGFADKTWTVFQKVFGQKCGLTPADVKPENSYFFDDTVHQNILDRIGTDHYFKVNPYKKDIPYDIVNKCFREALESQGLQNDPTYFEYISSFYNGERSIGGILNTLANWNRSYKLVNLPFTNDIEMILQRLDAIFPTSVAVNEDPTNMTSPAPQVVDIPPPAPAPNQTLNRAPAINAPLLSNSSSVPFFGGKRHRKHHRKSRKPKKIRKGTRKN